MGIVVRLLERNNSLHCGQAKLGVVDGCGSSRSNTRLTCCCRARSPAFSLCSPAARACRRTSPRCLSSRSLTSLTRSWRAATATLPASEPQLSGFRLLPSGEAAFNARIDLAWRAQASIDAQYYLVADDEIGHQFLRALRDAAGRGVRVRLKQLGCGVLTRVRQLSSLAPVSDLLQQLEEHEPLCLGQVPHDLSIGLEQCREGP